MLYAVPALRALRAAAPQAQIALVGLPSSTQFASRFSSYIDDFVSFPGHPSLTAPTIQHELIPAFHTDMRARRIDLAIQLHGSGQISNGVVAAFGARIATGYVAEMGNHTDPHNFMPYPYPVAEQLRFLNLIEFLGAPAKGKQLELPLTKDDQHALRDTGLLDGLKVSEYVCLHPVADVQNQGWSTQLFAQVADRIAEEFGLKIVLTSSTQQNNLAAEVASHMRTIAIYTDCPLSFGAMAALTSRARLLICNDSDVLPIAEALHVPSIGIFNNNDVERWRPLDAHLHRGLCTQNELREKNVETVLQNARALLSTSPPEDKQHLLNTSAL